MEQAQTNAQPQPAQEKDKVVDLVELLRTTHDVLLVGSYPLRFADVALSCVKNLQQVIAVLELKGPAAQQAVAEKPESKG